MSTITGAFGTMNKYQAAVNKASKGGRIIRRASAMIRRRPKMSTALAVGAGALAVHAYNKFRRNRAVAPSETKF